jgi:hypothetical protein
VTRAIAAVLACLAVSAVFAVAVVSPGGARPEPGAQALGVEFWESFTPAGQRMVVGYVPPLADHLQLTVGGATRVVPIGQRATFAPDGRRYVAVGVEGTGPWRVDALWAEHVLGSADGGALTSPVG